MPLNQYLPMMVEKNASDLFITAGTAPSVKINGQMVALSEDKLTPQQAKDITFSMLDEEQKEELMQNKELNFALNASGVGRFRGSAFFQRNSCGLVLRRINIGIPSIDELNLPSQLKDMAMFKRGLILVVGATGSGKSTTLAAILNHRNANSQGHILTVEDPIEFVHRHNGCIVTQREVGVDTESFEVALKNCLRQAPDVIMIGEIRTRESMQHAIEFAETGHLCLATLHSNNANQALERIINFFPADKHNQIWMDLSLNLRGIVAQQLVVSQSGEGRKAAVEILLNTPLMSDLIREGATHELKALMEKSTELGMQTFDQALLNLFERKLISYEDAISHADRPNDLRLQIKLTTGISYEDEDTGPSFSLQEP